MQAIQSSRRIFLGNLALLTAGAVWAQSVPSLFSEHKMSSGPEATWSAICARYKGAPGNMVPTPKKELPFCKGHTHREGQLMYFPAEKIRAQPVWIYWANNPRPSDLIVHFYKQDDSVITLNQYELQALLNLHDAPSKNSIRPLTTFLKVNGCGQRAQIAQTTVYSNKIRTVHIS